MGDRSREKTNEVTVGKQQNGATMSSSTVQASKTTVMLVTMIHLSRLKAFLFFTFDMNLDISCSYIAG